MRVGTYYEDLNVTFVRIPKTASMSIARAFFGKGESVDHVVRGSKSFAVIRHPVDRFVSGYSMMKQRHPDLTVGAALDIIQNPHIIPTKTTDWGFIKLHLMPMSSPNFQLCRVEKILRFEYLFDEGWKELAEYIGVPVPEIRHERGDYPIEGLTLAEREKVKTAYAKDMTMFGYEYKD